MFNKQDNPAHALAFVGLLLWLIALGTGHYWLMAVGFVLAIPALDGWFRD